MDETHSQSGGPARQAAEADAARAGGEAPESPYSNLWVPLVIVPAAIVVAIVLVFVFFGAISGTEKTPSQNLEEMLRGGANERTQAAWNLVLQLQENWEALAAGREVEWEMEGEFRQQLHAAWSETTEDDYSVRYLLASVQAQLGESEGVPRLIALLGITGAEGQGRRGDFRHMIDSVLARDGEDVVVELKLQVIYELGVLAVAGGGFDAAQRERVAEAIRPFAADPDKGLRLVAAAALQNLPGEETRQVLEGLLRSADLDLRGQAAISLSHLGDPGGAEVLRELIEPGSYELERAADPARWTQGAVVSQARSKAVLALGRLDRPEDRDLLESLAADEPDLAVRQAAMRALEAPR